MLYGDSVQGTLYHLDLDMNDVANERHPFGQQSGRLYINQGERGPQKEGTGELLGEGEFPWTGQRAKKEKKQQQATDVLLLLVEMAVSWAAVTLCLDE